MYRKYGLFVLLPAVIGGGVHLSPSNMAALEPLGAYHYGKYTCSHVFTTSRKTLRTKLSSFELEHGYYW